METFSSYLISIQTFSKDFSESHPVFLPYVLFIVYLFPILLCCMIINYIFVKKIASWSRRVKSPIAGLFTDMIRNINIMFYLALSLYMAAHFAGLKGIFLKVLFTAFLFVSVFEIIRVIEKISLFILRQYMAKSRTDEDSEPVIGGWINILLKTVLWTLALLFILNNLGIKITALAASLGITSIAVAFALQNILADIFSSVSIYLDQPFKENDFIIIGNDMGTVQKIGIKTTRIKTLQGEELVVSNHELTSTRIRNFKQMDKRRVVFQFGVVYSTPIEKVRAIPGYIKQVVEGQEMAELDRAHFYKFGDSDLVFETVYYVTTGDYNTYMDVQQSINLGIMEMFKNEEIDFAFPTRTIHIEK